jgi:formate hydrogenlyase subunit 4
MRLGILVALIANLFFPWGVATSAAPLAVAIGLAALALKVTAIVIVIALVEVRTAKLRLFRVPELLAGGFVLAVLAVVTGLVTR